MSTETEVSRSSSPVIEGPPTVVDVLYFLTAHRWLVLYFPFAASLIAALVALALPNVYTATARILPPQQSQNMAAAFLGSIGGLEGATGAALGLKNPADLYIGILQSRSIADALIARFDLKSTLGVETLVDTRKALAKLSTISAGKDGLISVDVDSRDPTLAADIANAYVEELDTLIQGLAIGEAGQRRLFLERQLSKAKEQLTTAEIALQKTQEQTGIIRIDEQGKAIIEAVAQVRAQIAAKEVELASLRAFATPQNPQYARARQELAGLRTELSKLERSRHSGDPDIFVPMGKVPEVGVEYVRKLREVKYHETVFELIARQYELARVEEAKDAAIVQIVDRAMPPDKKSKPARTAIVIATALLASLLGLIVAFMADALRTAKSDPGQNAKLVTVVKILTRRTS
jgi:tyrosine-protein kinase Etk/Wzc